MANAGFRSIIPSPHHSSTLIIKCFEQEFSSKGRSMSLEVTYETYPGQCLYRGSNPVLLGFPLKACGNDGTDCAVVAVCYLLLYDGGAFVEVFDCPFISAAMLGDR